MQPLHTSERKGRGRSGSSSQRGRYPTEMRWPHSSAPGQPGVQPGQPLTPAPGTSCTCTSSWSMRGTRSVTVRCSQRRSQTGVAVCYPAREPPHTQACPWPPPASLANGGWPWALWSRVLHTVIIQRTMYRQQPLRRGFVHFSSCVPALGLSYHATLGPQ